MFRRLFKNAEVPSGTLISEVISPIITARLVRASDRRKAAQEDAMRTRKDTRPGQARARREGDRSTEADRCAEDVTASLRATRREVVR